LTQLHALIIDDNAKNLDILARLLAQQGIISIKILKPSQLELTLQDGQEANIVFLDLELPGTDGYTILHTLKANPRFTRVPIVAYTVHVSELDVAQQQGFDSFIGKPVDGDRFPDQLSRILQGESVWESA